MTPKTTLRALALVISLHASACASSLAPATNRLEVATASPALVAAERPGLPQHPDVDPAGEWIVFSHAGDIWSVPAAGGVAARLTAHPANERRAVFAPDGSSLAFESNRDGANNLYRLPLSRSNGRLLAGAAQRVTHTDRSETLGGFTPDGERLVFDSSREPGLYRSARLFSVSVDGGPITRLTDAFGYDPRPGADGRIVFRRGRDLHVRPAYDGPGTPQLWVLSADSQGLTPLVDVPGSEHAGHGLPDGGAVFVSSRTGSNQVWLRAADGRERQLTDFQPGDGVATIGHGVRDFRVSSDGDTAVFCVWDRLYRMDLTAAEPRPVEVDV
ncbi:MAG: hypothetical protein AAFZ65_17615, partial [Planctomycetota bacterium]